MKTHFLTIVFMLITFLSCDLEKPRDLMTSSKSNIPTLVEALPKIDTIARTIKERFIVPEGFRREVHSNSSFQSFLQSLPLKPADAKVHYYNGFEKANHNIYSAVIDLPIGKRDLHQCADAVMRLRADYLRSQKDYEAIHFNFTNGMQVDYSNWRKGQRIKVEGNKTTWIDTASPSDSEQSYWKYLEMIFAYAGTFSLEKELKPVSINHLEIGDVFIQGGSPGHAVIVVDKAINSDNEIIFLLAQSYMPAQELQILCNPKNKDLSPWYEIPEDRILETPEWTFHVDDLKQF